MKYRKSS